MKTQRKILNMGYIARHTEGLRRYFGWPTVCCDEAGVLYTVVSRRMLHECPFGQICLYRSTDGGITWSEPQVIVDNAMDDRDAGIFYLGGGRMIVSYFTVSADRYEEGGRCYSSWTSRAAQTLSKQEIDEALARLKTIPEAYWGGASFVAVSEDYGETWSEDVIVPVSAPHGPTMMHDGSLLYVGSPHNAAAYNKCTGKEETYPAWGAISVTESRDGGVTWAKKSDIPMPQEYLGFPGGHVFYCEPHVVQLQSGMLIAVMRRDDNTEFMRRSEMEYVYISYSQNGGASWTVPVPVRNADGETVIGSPPHVMETKEGAVVISYSRRVAPCGIRAVVSFDGGYTFGEEIILGQNWNPEDSDLGYPATAQLADGSLITVSYYKYLLDTTPSLMYTKWDYRKI